MKNFRNKTNGFAALISSVIISTILMIILFTANTSNFFARFDALDAEYKQISMGLAESCVNQALLKLAQDYSYDPNDESISVSDNVCRIKSVTPHSPRGENSTLVAIIAQGIHKGAFSNLQVEASVWNPSVAPTITPIPPNIEIKSWQEIPSLP